MYLDYSNPYFKKALDLIMRDCWRDMEEDDFEAIADRCDCEWHNGASKFVLTHKSWDFVLKIPFYGDGATINYCAKELQDYQEICEKYPMIAPLFAKIEFLDVYGEMPVYAQEKVNTIFSDWLGDISCEDYYGLRDKTYDRIRADEEFAIVCNNARRARLNKMFCELIAETFGLIVLKLFAKWIMESNQGDLHNSNVGFTANEKPIVFDYSGFYD